MYNINLKIKIDKEIVAGILKKVKTRTLEEYVNKKLKEEIEKS